MGIFQSIEKQLDRWLIHKSLHEDIEKLGRARFIVYALFFSSCFVSIYTITLELTHEEFPIIKTISNYFGAILGFLSIIAVRLYGKIKIALTLNLILGFFFVIVSAYYSGGLFSVDVFWLVILTSVSYLFVNARTGFWMGIYSIGVVTIFFVLQQKGLKDFWYENQKSGLNYEYFNLLFLLFFSSLIFYFYEKGITRIKNELALLKEKQVKDIGDKYQYITENATDIIALHQPNGYANYISPAAEKILFYSIDELLGYKYAGMIDFSVLESRGEKTVTTKNKYGQEVYLEITYSKIHQEFEGKEVYITIARDVTGKVLENKKIQLLREQLANDFHDEMGNKLAAITLNSNLLIHQMGNENKLNIILKNIEETSKSLYQNSRDFIWSIDAKSDRLDEIAFYLKDFGEDFMQHFSIKFTSDFPPIEELVHYQLPMYSGRHLILIFKEAITNAVKHAGATEIILGLRIENESFQLYLDDNGNGFPAELKKGKGLLSMQQRAQRMGGILELISSKKGTSIKLSAKLPIAGR